MSKFVYLNKSQSEDMRFNTTGHKTKYVNVRYVLDWINTSRLNLHPLPIDKQSIAQNEVYSKLITLITEEELE